MELPAGVAILASDLFQGIGLPELRLQGPADVADADWRGGATRSTNQIQRVVMVRSLLKG